MGAPASQSITSSPSPRLITRRRWYFQITLPTSATSIPDAAVRAAGLSPDEFLGLTRCRVTLSGSRDPKRTVPFQRPGP